MSEVRILGFSVVDKVSNSDGLEWQGQDQRSSNGLNFLDPSAIPTLWTRLQLS